MFVIKNPSKVSAHGEERIKRQVVDNGRVEYLRREKYCIRHGWVDVLAAGGDHAWDKNHGRCGTFSVSGSAEESGEESKSSSSAGEILPASSRRAGLLA